MPQPMLYDDTGRQRAPVSGPPAIVVIAILWVTFACALPLYQVRAARRQAHQDLLHILATDKPDSGSLLAVFDRANQKLDAAASGSCLIFAFTSIILINQMLKLRRRYNVLVRELPTPDQRRTDAD